METDKKVGSSIATKNINTYKALRDLTNDDLKELPVVKVELTRLENKNFGVSYKWSVPFGFAHLESRKLDEIGYYTILDCKKVESSGKTTYVSACQRFIKGTTKDGKEYHQLQLILGYRCFLTYLINDNELRLATSWIKQGKMKPINWVVVPVVNEDDLNVNIGSDIE